MTTEQMLAETALSAHLAIIVIPSIILLSMLIPTLMDLPRDIKNYLEKRRKLKRLEVLDKNKGEFMNEYWHTLNLDTGKYIALLQKKCKMPKKQMSLDEAIEHCKQKAKEANNDCARDHAQLAEWLTELKARRNDLAVVGTLRAMYCIKDGCECIIKA